MSFVSSIALWCHDYDGETVQKYLPIAGSPVKPDGGDKVFCASLFVWALCSKDLSPLIRLLELVTCENADRAERRWIQYFVALGSPLLNTALCRVRS